MKNLSVTLPIITKNPLNGSTGNSRAAGIYRSKNRKEQRSVTRQRLYGPCRLWRDVLKDCSESGCAAAHVVITLTRVSPGTLDNDGCQAALKSVRDGVADALGVKDNSPLVRWEYGQEKPQKNVPWPVAKYAVKISIGAAAS